MGFDRQWRIPLLERRVKGAVGLVEAIFQMNRNSLLGALALALSLSGCGVGADGEPVLGTEQNSLDAIDSHGNGHDEPPMLGQHNARGEGKTAGHGGGSSPNLSLHGGNVLSQTTSITAIYWGAKWANPDGGSAFVADKQTGLEQFYTSFGGSSYANTSGEYAGADGNPVSIAVTYAGAIVDTTKAPSGAPSTSAILGEVCRQITTPSPNAYYPVYTDTPRGHTSYCAWHSWGSCGGVNVQFGFFFSLDNDPGCDPQDPGTDRSQGLEALANVSGHELSETLTDPRGNGWTDNSGNENADKCAWEFLQPVTLADGSSWKIQGNWSNAAYDGGVGYPNSSGQKGCLYSR
jgi:hypothetical protein